MDEPLVETELADSEPSHRSGPWKLIALVAVATAIGVWLVPGDAPEDAPSVAQAPPAAPSLLQPVAPPIVSDPSIELEPTAAGPRVGRPGSRARSLITQMRSRGAVDLAEVYDAAQQAQADGELADAYMLYFFAAREGHADAALALATQADPYTRDPENSVFEAADLTQAHKWYQVAAQNGSREAAQQLAAMRSRVEELAADGDVQAQRIALLWQ